MENMNLSYSGDLGQVIAETWKVGESGESTVLNNLSYKTFSNVY